MSASAEGRPSVQIKMGFKQFISLIAALMAANALAIDTMLPALPLIGHEVGFAGANQQQWVITSYLLGFGAAQIIYGPLADRFGRKPVLLWALAIYVIFTGTAAFAQTAHVMIAARILQGVGAAATRVLSVSIVRDCFAGSQMARVMSLSFIVFLAVPILAPSIGQIIMLFGPWRLIFGAMAMFGFVLMIWVALRLPETLHPGDRLPLEFARVLNAFRVTLTNRIAAGYMLAMTLILGALFGFINSAQQIFVTTFGAPRLFTMGFAFIAVFMALSSFVNSRIVGRFGAKLVSHGALGGFILVAAIHAMVAISGHETIWLFAGLLSGNMFCFGLVVSNFGSIAMGPLGHVAGTASSVQGFVTTFGGALLGLIVGQHYDGTAVPLTLGFAIYGTLAFGIIYVTERGRLFQPEPPALAATGV
jgi:DHA1 family bicyclomycin/chloramphenicol resistance-like MFS transporter